ncbi:MAG TPA: helix-hairpin-helix domain-containing protein [Ilumatobacter sp.]|nr:helix-hairpin-helix domain-containing protein [Ilumatobacter sp.]
MPDVLERHADSHGPEIPRPAPPRRLIDLAGAWFAWFGVARMLSLGVTVALVGAGGYWLLNAPPPPVEASLPFATTSTTTVANTGGAPPEGVDPTGAVGSPGAITTGTTAPPTTVPGPAFVHVAGAVLAPGVYELPPNARVVDAIEAARGPTGEAMLDGVNLAARIADGQRIYVPQAGEVDPTAVDNGPRADSSDAGTVEPSVPAGPIDLNRATIDELDTLPGVGPSTAAAIVDDRERNGPFATVDDLDRVAGIGPAKLDALRGLVTV